MNIRTLIFLLAAFSAGARAAVDPPIPADPYVPPAKRVPDRTPPAAGAALREQALAKLRQRFNEADLDASGDLTLAEARRAKLGFVVKHFQEIDSAGRGKISFDDLQAYLQRRREAATQDR